MRDKRMASRAALLVLAVMAVGFSAGVAGAGQCDEPQVYLFTRFTAPDEIRNPSSGAQVGNPTVASAAVGCTVAEETGEEVDTNLISPGSNSFSIRSFGDAPVSASVVFAGQTHTFGADDFKHNSAGWFDTKAWTYWDQAASVGGGDATVTVCDAEGCVTRTYHAIG